MREVRKADPWSGICLWQPRTAMDAIARFCRSPTRVLRIHVFAASGPAQAKAVERGIGVLRASAEQMGIEIELSESANLGLREGYFAGPDNLRRDEFIAGYSKHDVDVLWAARGGYGATRLLAKLDDGAPSQHSRVLVGFSDVTALHAWHRTRGGPASLHAPGICQLPELDPRDVHRCLDFLSAGHVEDLEVEGGTAVHGGVVRGPLFVANLEILRSLVGTDAMPDLRGWILGLEEVGEAPYRVDRCLTQLRASGALRGVRAFALGQFSGRDPSTGAITAASDPRIESVAVQCLEDLRVPILAGLPFGHAAPRNAALPIGLRVELDVPNARLRCLESLVEFE